MTRSKMVNMNKRKEIVEFFDAKSEARDEIIESDTIVDYEQRLRQQFISELLRIGPDDVILDAGCGNCRDAEYLITSSDVRPGMYITMDISQGMLRGCKEQSNLARFSLVQADLLQIPIRTGTVTKLICTEVLEHIPDWTSAVSEFARVLKPGGDLIVSTPNIYSMYYPQKKVLEEKKGTFHPHDVWKSYWVLKNELVNTGFDIKDVKGSCYLPGLLSYRGLTRRITERALNGIERLERSLLGGSPLRYFGYTIIIKAMKKI